MDSKKILTGLNTAIEAIDAATDVLREMAKEIVLERSGRKLKGGLGDAIKPKEITKIKEGKHGDGRA